MDKAEKTILISHNFIEKKLGIKLSSEKVEEIFKKLRFSFQTKQIKETKKKMFETKSSQN